MGGGAQSGDFIDLGFFERSIIFSGDTVAGEIVADNIFFGSVCGREFAGNFADGNFFYAGGFGEFFGFKIFGGFDHKVVPNGRGDIVAVGFPVHGGAVSVTDPSAGDQFCGVADSPEVVGEDFFRAELFVAGAGFGSRKLAGDTESRTNGIILVGKDAVNKVSYLGVEDFFFGDVFFPLFEDDAFAVNDFEERGDSAFGAGVREDRVGLDHFEKRDFAGADAERPAVFDFFA